MQPNGANMTKIPRLDILERRSVVAIAGAAFVLGFLLASMVPNAIKADAAVTLPQPVSRMVRSVGDYVCRNWGGLSEAYLVAPGSYTYVCQHHATISGVRIHHGSK